MLVDPPRDFYDELTVKIGELIFGTPQAHQCCPYKILIDAWLKANRLGPDDIRRWFEKQPSKS